MAKQILIQLQKELNQKISDAIAQIDALEGEDNPLHQERNKTSPLQECNKTNPLKKKRMGKKRCGVCGAQEPYASLCRHYFYRHATQKQKNHVTSSTDKKGQFGALLFKLYPELQNMSKLA